MTLLDRAAFPRDKPCGEYLTPGAVGIAAGRTRRSARTAGRRRGAADARNGRSPQRPRVRRRDGGPRLPAQVTDQVLRDAAEAAGVRVIEGVNVRRILS